MFCRCHKPGEHDLSNGSRLTIAAKNFGRSSAGHQSVDTAGQFDVDHVGRSVAEVVAD